jgi:hypothetical protein
MKKVILLVIIAVCLFSCVGCGEFNEKEYRQKVEKMTDSELKQELAKINK